MVDNPTCLKFLSRRIRHFVFTIGLLAACMVNQSRATEPIPLFPPPPEEPEPRFTVVGGWSMEKDLFNDEERLVATVVDPNVTTRLQFYCQTGFKHPYLGVGVENKTLDAVRSHVWIRSRLMGRPARNGYLIPEDSYHFSIFPFYDDLKEGGSLSGKSLLIGFPVSGREIVLRIDLDDRIDNWLRSHCTTPEPELPPMPDYEPPIGNDYPRQPPQRQ
jgi:hypothetical protein